MYLGGLHPRNIEPFLRKTHDINAHFKQHNLMVQYQHSYDPPLDKASNASKLIINISNLKSTSSHHVSSQIDPELPRRRFPYTGLAYAMTPNAAHVMLDLLDQYGFA